MAFGFDPVDSPAMTFEKVLATMREFADLFAREPEKTWTGGQLAEVFMHAADAYAAALLHPPVEEER